MQPILPPKKPLKTIPKNISPKQNQKLLKVIHFKPNPKNFKSTPKVWTLQHTISVSHLLLSGTHVGKVINNGLGQIFQASQLYFQWLQFFCLGQLVINSSNVQFNSCYICFIISCSEQLILFSNNAQPLSPRVLILLLRADLNWKCVSHCTVRLTRSILLKL